MYARFLKILSLPESVKKYLGNNKNDSSIVRVITLRKLLYIFRQGDEGLQQSIWKIADVDLRNAAFLLDKYRV